MNRKVEEFAQAATKRLTAEERNALIKRLSEKKGEKEKAEEGDKYSLSDAVEKVGPISYSELEELAEGHGFSRATQLPGQKGARIVKLLSPKAAKLVFPAKLVEKAKEALKAGKPILPPGFVGAVLHGAYPNFYVK